MGCDASSICNASNYCNASNIFNASGDANDNVICDASSVRDAISICDASSILCDACASDKCLCIATTICGVSAPVDAAAAIVARRLRPILSFMQHRHNLLCDCGRRGL